MTDHRVEAEGALSQEAGNTEHAIRNTGEATVHALLAIHDLLDERLPASDPDAEFIAHARTDVAALLAEVERLRAGIESIRDRSDILYRATGMSGSAEVANLQTTCSTRPKGTTMTDDPITSAADVILDATPDVLGYRWRYARAAARALANAGLLATPKHDAQAAARALRDSAPDLNCRDDHDLLRERADLIETDAALAEVRESEDARMYDEFPAKGES